MEEPSDENRALPEKKQKRIVKTPSQVAALENFYNEHKYPTEAMKLELAESIGLTEKQVSGWFCHRRLKDKKSPNDEVHTHGKQDRSSGVIQDRGSGLRQDSCGSTKQGDNKHSNEPKEVESRRFTTSQGLLPTQLRYDHNNSNANNNINSIMGDDDDDDDDDDDTSSGSGSALKDQSVVDRLGMVTSKYPTHSNNNNNDVKTVKGRSGPSGYLKVKGQVENAAITAVKRQLGRHYREDGPPLGIEFESLPPGAFDNPVKIPVNQSYYVGDRSALHSVDGSKTIQHPNTSKMYERYNSKSYHPIDLDESGLETRHASKHREYSNKQRRNFQTEINQDSNRHLIPYGKNMDANPPKLTYRDRIEPMPSDFTAKRGEFVEVVDPTRGLSRKTPKVLTDDKFDGERRVVIDDYSKLGPAKIRPGNETRAVVTKRSRDEFIQHGYPRKDSFLEVPPRTNKIKRSAAEMTSSFSDDETAETTSGD